MRNALITIKSLYLRKRMHALNWRNKQNLRSWSKSGSRCPMIMLHKQFVGCGHQNHFQREESHQRGTEDCSTNQLQAGRGIVGMSHPVQAVDDDRS